MIDLLQWFKLKWQDKNPYHSIDKRVDKLIQQYKDYGPLIIGVDFDHTIYCRYTKTARFEATAKLLKEAQSRGHILCVWTANPEAHLVASVWQHYGLTVDYYNKSPINFGTEKPHFSLLLDDIAGLSEATKTLQRFLRRTKKMTKGTT